MKAKGRGFALCSALPTEVFAKVGALCPELQPLPGPFNNRKEVYRQR